MDTFKQLMAFPLYLTVVWLVWVFAGQTGPDGVAALLGGLVALAFALWLAGRPAARRPTAVASHAAVALALLGALAALGSAIRNQAGPVDAADANWEPFSEQRLAEVNADPEQAAFVNMTADWCVTCLVNERVALNTERVRSAMRDHDVVYFKGDWTRRDPAITRYLERFDRSGVPLYVFYPAAGADAPVVLPQILTPAAVADILSQR
jgi:thiol:disulfide interchange protein DsbD